MGSNLFTADWDWHCVVVVVVFVAVSGRSRQHC
jgi:hypothetical protein